MIYLFDMCRRFIVVSVEIKKKGVMMNLWHRQHENEQKAIKIIG